MVKQMVIKRGETMNEQDLKAIIAKVMNEVGGTTHTHEPETSSATEGQYLGVYSCVEEAIKEAKTAQRKLKVLPIEFREKIITNIRRLTMENAHKMAVMGVEETGMGKIGHKELKHQLVAEKTPGTECIKPTVYTGDQGLTLVENGAWGVIGAITPSTNPSETVICNAIGMFAAGNTVVFNPHPNAKNVSNFAVDLVNQAAKEAGLDYQIAFSIESPTLETGKVIFDHKDIPMLVATGGPGVVKAIMSSGKRAIGAGAGNPPVLVDETAKIAKAAADIINGATFDNNLPCIAEKEVIVVDEVADELVKAMIADNDCYFLSPEQTDELTKKVLVENRGRYGVNRDYVGKDAPVILKSIGINADESIRCIIFEGSKDHILVVEELMMPILGIVRVKDIDEGIEVAIELEHGNRHSAHMHSMNVENLTRFARAIDTAVFVKNAPSYAGLGFGGEGYTTFTIASKTGEGLTNAATFTKSRRCVMADYLYIR